MSVPLARITFTLLSPVKAIAYFKFKWCKLKSHKSDGGLNLTSYNFGLFQFVLMNYVTFPSVKTPTVFNLVYLQSYLT